MGSFTNTLCIRRNAIFKKKKLEIKVKLVSKLHFLEVPRYVKDWTLLGPELKQSAGLISGTIGKRCG